MTHSVLCLHPLFTLQYRRCLCTYCDPTIHSSPFSTSYSSPKSTNSKYRGNWSNSGCIFELSLHHHCNSGSFSKVLNTIVTQDGKLSVKYFTSTLAISQVFKVPPCFLVIPGHTCSCYSHFNFVRVHNISGGSFNWKMVKFVLSSHFHKNVRVTRGRFPTSQLP